MMLAEAIRTAHRAKFPGETLIRREVWLPTAPGLEVGDDRFWSFQDGRAILYVVCPEDILADDWVVTLGESSDPYGVLA